MTDRTITMSDAARQLRGTGLSIRGGVLAGAGYGFFIRRRDRTGRYIVLGWQGTIPDAYRVALAIARKGK